ncbi:MAG: hypothetical protein AAF696_17370 [Bacteroidota bacterium]
MKYIIAIIFGLIIENTVYATGQIPDYLIIGKDTSAIFSNPLESYFEQVGHKKLIGFKGCTSTACWRGYKAYWELKNDSLFLNAIRSCHRGEWCPDVQDADLQKMFGSDKVFAYWYSGTLRIPQGKRLQYIHMGYSSIYEADLYISFKKGFETHRKIVSNKKESAKIELAKKQMEIAAKVQDTLFYQVKMELDWDTSKTAKTYLCDETYILRYNRKGKLRRVWVDWEAETFGEKLDEWRWNTTDDRQCRRIIKRALKQINISYLDLPKQKIELPFEIYFNRKTGKLELLKEFWMEDL